MTLPAWTAEVYPDKLRTLSDFSFAMKAYTKEMQRLRGGQLTARNLTRCCVLARHNLASH